MRGRMRQPEVGGRGWRSRLEEEAVEGLNVAVMDARAACWAASRFVGHERSSG